MNAKILIALCLIALQQGCSQTTKKFNGVSFVAAPQAVDASDVKPLVQINANAAAVMPFGYIKNLNHPKIIYNTNKQWFGETYAGAKQYIETLQAQNISIMLKPQLWVWQGEYTGHIEMQSEGDWQTLESSYTAFILEFAKLANTAHVAIFCIGTELELFVKYRPNYWKKLIQQIRQIYNGTLTYAANWDEYKRVPFWTKLDYIGIDAYFPISSIQTPSVKDCLENWMPLKKELLAFSQTHKRPIMFTEFGYRSVDFTGRTPWVSDTSLTSINLEAQTNTTKALFEAVWNENWFAGGFIWKWFINDDAVGGKNNNQFTPQNKPVETTITHYYNLHR